MEDRSRRNNLRIDGIDENGQESWGDSEEKVHAFFWQNLGLKNIEIERAHRTGLKKDGRPRTIVLNLQKYKDQIRILKESHRLKGKNCFINEDFSRETVVIPKKLFAEVKQRRSNGENVSVRYDKIVYLNKNFENNLNK
ncbi:uncharacterized protein LOC136075749 [Hydra vulgaris]|uniref:Uncharacterized protein LOC136075749 n=1 Tax=Hydra vulgaris TaxID=6087 RepID=A0ABM4B8Q0_HYDVU